MYQQLNKTIMKNQIKYDFPEIGHNQEWKICGYLNGKSMNRTRLEVQDFSQLQFIGQSGNFYHAIGDGNIILILTILIKK